MSSPHCLSGEFAKTREAVRLIGGIAASGVGQLSQSPPPVGGEVAPASAARQEIIAATRASPFMGSPGSGCAALYRSPVAIAGLGNLLCSDDGVGIHAARMLKAMPIPGVDIVEVGTAVLHGVDCLASAERILLLDAVQAGHAPGTICFFDADDVSPCGATKGSEISRSATGNHASGGLLSVHAIGLREAFCLLSPEKQPRFTVIGVEPGSLGYGTELTPCVAGALPTLVAEARAIVCRWLDELAASPSRAHWQTQFKGECKHEGT